MNETCLTGKVIAVSVSETRGEKKKNVDSVYLKENFGIIGDAHAGKGPRQVSLLAMESVEKMRKDGLDLRPGDFGENITTQGFDLLNLKPGDKIRVGTQAVLEISRLGKECIKPCSIYYRAGRCIMPKEGVFARVLEGGRVTPGQEIEFFGNKPLFVCAERS